MQKINIGTTKYGAALGLNQLAMDALGVLVKGKLRTPNLVLTGEDLNAISSIKVHTRSVLTDIFVRVLAEDKLSAFTFLNFSDFPDSVPEVFTNPDLIVDGKYVAKTIPTGYQTAWVNVTPILSKRDAYNSGLWITDIQALAGQITKGMLCMSYNDSDQWLTPQLCVFVVRSYSHLIANMLGNVYNLEFEERRLVQTVFAAYFAQLVSPVSAPQDIPPLLLRCTFLGNAAQVTERMNLISDARAKLKTDMLSIDNCCKILAAAGPSRLKTLTSDHVYTPMSRSPGDSQNMLFALDYPPYWVYQIMANMQGSKNPMFTNMIKNADLKRDIIAFATELSASKLFINKVNR